MLGVMSRLSGVIGGALLALACQASPSGGSTASVGAVAGNAGAFADMTGGSGGSGGRGGAGGSTGVAGQGGLANGGTGGSNAGAGATSTAGGAGPAEVDASSLLGKHLFGYQGWFSCAGDGGANRWVHWFRNNTPNAQNATFDLWPDTSELGDDELFASQLTFPSGAPARIFSPYVQKTVVRHFNWMKSAGIDGVFVQRFLSDVKDAGTRAVRDQVLQNARAGAEQNGRVLAVMYDISGASEATLVADLEAEWQHVTRDLKLTESPRYLRHRGKAVLAIWGLGFNDRPGSAAQAKQLLADLRTGPNAVTVLGGVPTGWRTLNDDSKTDAAWAEIYRSFDVVSPWAVGRFADDAGADNFAKEHIAPDLAELEPLQVDYMPVVFPGFSWHNLNAGPLNQIPRRGGAFYWHQVYNAVKAGSNMLYGAMFDEVDEGTAFFKIVSQSSQLPAQGTFLALDADGQTLPSDWYLTLAGKATQTLRGEMPLSSSLPLTLP